MISEKPEEPLAFPSDRGPLYLEAYSPPARLRDVDDAEGVGLRTLVEPADPVVSRSQAPDRESPVLVAENGPLGARGDMDDKNPQPGHGKPVTVKQTAGEDTSVPRPGKAVAAPPLRGEGTSRQKDEEEGEE